MIFNPNKIVKECIIENLEGGSYEVQQNGIDLTLESVELIRGGFLGKEDRKINEYTKEEIEGNVYEIKPNQSYSIMFQQKINVPENMCAQIIQRSTLNRMGGFILSGLYDSGFKNQIGAVLRTNETIFIEKGARVAQIIFMEAESASLYQGVYQQNEKK